MPRSEYTGVDQAETVHVTTRPIKEAAPIVLNNDGASTFGLEVTSRHEENRARHGIADSVDRVGTDADSGIQQDDIIVQVRQTPVMERDQALPAFRAGSSRMQHSYVEMVWRGDEFFWPSLAIPG